jgi:hypothetical protein
MWSLVTAALLLSSSELSRPTGRQGLDTSLRPSGLVAPSSGPISDETASSPGAPADAGAGAGLSSAGASPASATITVPIVGTPEDGMVVQLVRRADQVVLHRATVRGSGSLELPLPRAASTIDLEVRGDHSWCGIADLAAQRSPSCKLVGYGAVALALGSGGAAQPRGARAVGALFP